MYTLEYDVRDGAYNWADPVTRSVEVIDNLAPKLAQSAPIKVYPADNTMRTVQLSECAVMWDLCDGYSDIMAHAYDLQITSNDPSMNPGDVSLINNATFAVKSTHNTDGTTRVYTATFKVDDSSLNTTTGTCKVYVPVSPTEPPPPSLAAQSGAMAGL